MRISQYGDKFNTRIQGKIESIDQYVTDLRIISKNCKFGALEEEVLRDRIVCGVFSEKVKERLLRDNELTFQKAIRMCPSIVSVFLKMSNLKYQELMIL